MLRDFWTKRVSKVFRYARRDFWINPQKYYVCSYRSDILICSLIGWYKASNGRILMERVFGKEAVDKYLIFLKGSQIKLLMGEVILSPYQVWVKGSPQEITHLGYFHMKELTSISFLLYLYSSVFEKALRISNHKQRETVIMDFLNHLFYGNSFVIPKNFKAKRSDLSEIQKIIDRRKRILYVQEDEEKS